MFALEKQTRLQRKQTRFILTLPVASAVQVHVYPHFANSYIDKRINIMIVTPIDGVGGCVVAISSLNN